MGCVCAVLAVCAVVVLWGWLTLRRIGVPPGTGVHRC